MGEGIDQDYWSDIDEFDFKVQNKTRNRLRKARKEITDKSSLAEESKTILLQSLQEIEIPQQSKALLTKLINNGQLTGIDKVLFESNKSIVVSGKVNKTHRNFPVIGSDDVIIKIHINGERDELYKRAVDESKQLKTTIEGLNKPTFLLQSGNIVIMTLVGQDGVPAQNLIKFLQSTDRNIFEVYSEVLKFWCLEREKAFDPLSILYHDGKWWSIGLGERMAFTYSYTNHCKDLVYFRSNLKAIIDLFITYGLKLQHAEDGFSELPMYDWATHQLMRGRTQKRSFFSLLYLPR